jgi:hypothetical protein
MANKVWGNPQKSVKKFVNFLCFVMKEYNDFMIWYNVLNVHIILENVATVCVNHQIIPNDDKIIASSFAH